MKTYEQKFGRLPDGLVALETPPEAWQFADPLVSVSKDGEVRKRELFVRPKAQVPKMKPISEILGKEDVKMLFADFDLDEQARLVAEEYNRNTSVRKMTAMFNLTSHRLYKLLDHAKSIGIQVTMRGACAPQASLVESEKKQSPVVSREDVGHAAKTTVDDFATAAKSKLEQAEKLAKEADLLQQAGTIALAIEELLGDKASPVISALYSEVAV